MVKKYAVIIFLFSGLFLWLQLSDGGDRDTVPPKVIDTNPKNHAGNVDPSLTRITVTFSKPMLDKSWSWSYEDKGTFPQMNGEPYYTDNATICTLPVILEPNKQYVIWINTKRHTNFRDRVGNPVEPFKLTFKTGMKR